jgi:host factor-I protein
MGHKERHSPDATPERKQVPRQWPAGVSRRSDTLGCGDQEAAVNRKLIRTTLAEIRERGDREPSGRQQRDAGGAGGQRKRVPPEQTNAEAFYYKKQMDNKTPMVVVLQDGEELRGMIEWYDRTCIKLHRMGAPNLLVLKHNIKYLYKESEGENDVDDHGELEDDLD